MTGKTIIYSYPFIKETVSYKTFESLIVCTSSKIRGEINHLIFGYLLLHKLNNQSQNLFIPCQDGVRFW